MGVTNEYLPTTEEVREAYVDRKDFEAQLRSGLHADDFESAGQFNAWLVAHDAIVRAAALRNAANDLPQYLPARDLVNRWLWDRAHRIENSPS